MLHQLEQETKQATTTYPHPYSKPRTSSPIRQPIIPNVKKIHDQKGKASSTPAQSFSPPLTSHWEEARRRQIRLRQLYTVRQCDKTLSWLTLTHKILEMMPLDIVREVSDVDTSVLLRVFAHVGHHLLLVFVVARTTTRCNRATGDRRTRPPVTATIAVTAARATARRVGTVSVPRAPGATTRRARAVALVNSIVSHCCGGQLYGRAAARTMEMIMLERG
jgi:hypothetical protein